MKPDEDPERPVEPEPSAAPSPPPEAPVQAAAAEPEPELAPEPEPEPPPQVEALAPAEPPPEPEPAVEETAYEPSPPEPEPIAEEPAYVAPPPEPEPVIEEPVYAEAPVEPEPAIEEPAYAEPAYAEAVQEHPYQEEAQPLYDAPVQVLDDPSLFGEPDIPMPPEHGARGRMRAQHARDAQKNLDLDLGRIKRRKRYGFFLTTLTVLFVAFILAPVTWAGIYLFVDPPSTVLMLQRAAEGQAIRHTPVPITRMSPNIVRAVIAAEDANFCTHDGFDVQAIQNAMESNADGGRMRGGSTISQQTAKNLFLWPSRSWVRKGFETYFTALIEFMWPKRRIMEAYLNAAEWGDGNFGIEAASRARFGVAAADLTPLQAARLAAVLPSPNRWRADSPGPYVRRRAASIVQRAQVVRNEHMSGCVLALDAARPAR